MSIITHIPVVRRAVVSLSMRSNTYILLCVSNQVLPILIGLYRHLTTPQPYIIPISPQYMVCDLFSFGWDLQRKNKKTGHVNALIRMEIYSSRHDIKDNMKTLFPKHTPDRKSVVCLGITFLNTRQIGFLNTRQIGRACVQEILS